MTRLIEKLLKTLDKSVETGPVPLRGTLVAAALWQKPVLLFLVPPWQLRSCHLTDAPMPLRCQKTNALTGVIVHWMAICVLPPVAHSHSAPQVPRPLL